MGIIVRLGLWLRHLSSVVRPLVPKVMEYPYISINITISVNLTTFIISEFSFPRSLRYQMFHPQSHRQLLSQIYSDYTSKLHKNSLNSRLLFVRCM